MPLAFPPGSDRLPPGRHLATQAEIEQTLVSDFAASVTRRPLFDQSTEMLEAIQSLVPVQRQWINGSFVTTKVDPNDIDLVSHIDGEAMDALKPLQRMLLQGLIAAHWSRDVSGCDSFSVAVYPKGHPARATYEKIAAWWDGFFGVDRAGQPKGYVELEIA